MRFAVSAKLQFVVDLVFSPKLLRYPETSVEQTRVCRTGLGYEQLG